LVVTTLQDRTAYRLEALLSILGLEFHKAEASVEAQVDLLGMKK
jgi:hypothetical protein